MTVRDWRYIVRIPNIDISDLTKDKSGSSADLTDLMIQACEKIPNFGAGRATWYVNRTISSFLRRQVLNTNNVRISMDEVAGKRALTFDGYPVRRCDSLLNTEAVVS
jgi:hypothetical protein